MKIRFTTQFDCPVARVWDYFTEPDNLAQWVPGFVAFRMLSEPPFLPGATYQMDCKQGSKMTTFAGELLELEEGKHLRERVTGGSFKPHQTMHMTYDFTDHSDRCSMVYTNEFNPGFFEGLMYKTGGRIYCKSMIKSLKDRVEALPQSTG